MTDYEGYISLDYVHSDKTIFPKRSRKEKEKRAEIERASFDIHKSALWKVKRTEI